MQQTFAEATFEPYRKSTRRGRVPRRNEPGAAVEGIGGRD